MTTPHNACPWCRSRRLVERPGTPSPTLDCLDCGRLAGLLPPPVTIEEARSYRVKLDGRMLPPFQTIARDDPGRLRRLIATGWIRGRGKIAAEMVLAEAGGHADAT